MANETLITDLVAQEALDQLAALDQAMQDTLDKYTEVGKELAKGLKIPVEVQGDLDKVTQVYNTQMKNAAQTTQQLTQIQQQQQQVIANTTNTISRQLAEQEKLNKAQREAYTEQQRGLDVANKTLGTYEQNIAALARLTKEMEKLKAEKKAGTISTEEYLRRELELKTAKSELQKVLANETKMMQAAEGSYKQLSQELHRLKEAYMQLNEAEKKGAQGKALEKEIQALDAHLKDLDADMGNFQRNVGNYAVAGQSLKAELRELTMQMAQMLADGVDPTSEGFLQVAERAGMLKDAMDDAKATIKDYSNDTQALTQGVSVLQTAVGGWQALEGAMSAFGMESKDAAAATQKLMGIMSLMNGIQKVSTEITTNGTGAYRAYHAILKLLGVEKAAFVTATKAEAVADAEVTAGATAAATAESATATATEAATVASAEHTAAVGVETAALTGATAAATALKLALAALGIGAVIALVVTLYETIKEFNEEAEKSAEIVEEVAKANDEANASYLKSKGEMEMYIHTIENFNGTKEQEKALVDELNSKYGDALGHYQSLDQWKKALTTTGLAYIETLEWEAQAQADLNAMVAAQRNGNKEDEEFYRNQFESRMQTIMKERDRIRREIERNTPKPVVTPTKSTSSRGGSNRTGATTDPAKEEENALKQMQNLIDEANKLYGDWEKTLAEKAIEMASVVTSTSAEALEEQRKQVEENYKKLSDLLEKDKEKTITETRAKYDAAIAEADKHKKDTTELTKAKDKAIETIEEQYRKRTEDKTAEMYETLEQMQRDYHNLRLQEVTDNTQAEIAGITASYNDKLGVLRELYLEELRLAEGNEEKIAEIKERYARENAEMAEDYAIRTTQATIDGLEEALKQEGLTDEQRAQMAGELAKAKIKLSELVTEAEADGLEQTAEDEEKARRKRIEKVEKWADKVQEAVSAVSELLSSIYDGQIAKVDEEMEAEQEHHDTAMANIDELAEHGTITTEEAELRKREEEARTAKAQEALEKKKAQLQYRAAVAEKANTISQIAIATALAIMKAAPNWVNIALVAALGAVQMATAIAQPIKAYKEGTKGRPHPGGLAIVGDGGKQELVAFGRSVWLTPDTPTLVDLPKGAEVFPSATPEDVQRLGASLPMAITRDKSSGMPVIINDYTALECRVAANTKAMGKLLTRLERNVTRELKNQSFNAYLKRRL